MPLRFTWDPTKAAENVRKHRVSFVEASTVFADTLSLTIPDPRHSLGEERLVILGYSTSGRLLAVAHTERERGAIIRIISARRATPHERRTYEEA